jgi:hypothetical protein
MPVPPAFDLDRAMADVHWLVAEVGARPHASAEERAASEGVAARLREAGWAPQEIGTPPTVVACRGRGGRLFLAHVDTVPGSPGAVDNGAGVATLLELARTTEAADLCLGFPVGEETGLIGSEALAAEPASWSPDGAMPSLVVSLDLTGHGELAMMGLGAAWDDAHLAWLTANLDPLPDTIWAYSVYSRLMPHAERSDHRPFALRGVPAMLLLGKGEGGIFSAYHQPADTVVEPGAVVTTAAALEALATAPAAPPAGSPTAGFIFLGWRLPGAAVWGVLALGLAAALRDLRAARELPGWLLRAGLAMAIAALTGAALTTVGLFAPHPAEQTAAAVMRMPATGWWPGALPAFGLGLLAFAGVRRALGPRGSAPMVAMLLAVPLAWVDPVLAFPFGLAAVLGALHPALSLLPMLVLLLPDRMRELAFHGLIPPLGWGALWLLATPLLGRYRPGRAVPQPPPELP